jgi:hypothetical protein
MKQNYDIAVGILLFTSRCFDAFQYIFFMLQIFFLLHMYILMLQQKVRGIGPYSKSYLTMTEKVLTPILILKFKPKWVDP